MSMTRRKIEDAREAARAFLRASDALLEELDAQALEERPWDPPGTERTLSSNDYSNGSARSGTLRRRSMDLTRSLAELRKPSW